jgi:hypothetical protein
MKTALLLVCLALSLATALAAPALAAGAPPAVPGQTIAVDAVADALTARQPAPPTDPPGRLHQDQLGAVTALAARLSRDRAWLTAATLKTLGSRALGLDEIFDGAPRNVAVEGVYYRIKLEKVGPRWSGFAADRDPFVVFLTQEVYDGLGKDRAIGYQNGEEVILVASDFDRLPAIALTLYQLTPDERRAARERPTRLEAKAQIALGAARPAVAFRPDGPTGIKPVRQRKEICPSEVAPTGCSGSTIQCPANYQPYFVVSGLRVYDNHEGCCFHGDPEIELYPLKIDSVSGPSGTLNATTPFVFSGRNGVDIAGRVRYMPDVDDGGALYPMDVALVPASLGSQFVALMVEDDDQPGKLILDNQSTNVGKVLDVGFQIFQDVRKMDRFELFKDSFSLLDLLGLFNNEDDLFQPSLGATNAFFCTHQLGGPFPNTITMPSAEWELQGYYACINATCQDPTPPPPPGGGGPEDPPPCDPEQLGGCEPILN